MVQSLLTHAPPSELRSFPLSHDAIPYPTPTPALQEAWVLRDPRGTIQALVSGPAFHSETRGRAGVRPRPPDPHCCRPPSPTQGAPQVPSPTPRGCLVLRVSVLLHRWVLRAGLRFGGSWGVCCPEGPASMHTYFTSSRNCSLLANLVRSEFR